MPFPEDSKYIDLAVEYFGLLVNGRSLPNTCPVGYDPHKVQIAKQIATNEYLQSLILPTHIDKNDSIENVEFD